MLNILKLVDENSVIIHKFGLIKSLLNIWKLNKDKIA